MANRKAGNEIKHGPELARMIEQLAEKNSQADVADYLGISVDTIRRRYLSEWQRGVAKRHLLAQRKLMELVKEKNPAAVFFYLKTQCGWRETQHVDHTSSDGSMATPAKLDVNVRFIRAARVDDGN